MSDSIELDTEVTVTIGAVDYFLVPLKEVSWLHTKRKMNQRYQNFLNFLADGPALATVFHVSPGQKVSKEALQHFRETVLEKDDIFQPPFLHNFVFYGSEQHAVHVDSDAIEQLSAWKTKTWTFIKGDADLNTRAGPYMFAHKQTWEPWRIYHDYNATFMTTFKPAKKDPKR